MSTQTALARGPTIIIFEEDFHGTAYTVAVRQDDSGLAVIDRQTGATADYLVFDTALQDLFATGGTIKLKKNLDLRGGANRTYTVTDMEGDILIEGEGMLTTTLTSTDTGAGNVGVLFQAAAWPVDTSKAWSLVFRDLTFFGSSSFTGYKFEKCIPMLEHCRIEAYNILDNGLFFDVGGSGPPGRSTVWRDIEIYVTQPSAHANIPYVVLLHTDGTYMDNVYVFNNGSNLRVFHVDSALHIDRLRWLCWGSTPSELLLFDIVSGDYPRKVCVNDLFVQINEAGGDISLVKAVNERQFARFDKISSPIYVGFRYPYDVASAEFISVGHWSYSSLGAPRDIFPSEFWSFPLIQQGPQWTADNVNGGQTANAMYIQNNTTVAANSRGARWAPTFGLALEGQNRWRIDFTKEIWLEFVATRVNSDAQAVTRVQLKANQAWGALAQNGVGIRIDNYDVFLETSLAAAQASVATGLTMTDAAEYYFQIRHIPDLQRVELYIDGALLAVQTTAANIPNTLQAVNSSFYEGIANGVAGGVDCQLMISNVNIKVRKR